jgi:uncharacterized protein (DUF2252 family)
MIGVTVAVTTSNRLTEKARHATHSTVAERTARGKAARRDFPRASHGSWAPPADRRDPIELLEEQSATRLPELVPIRYGRMAASPFAFFRGAATIMASDLAPTPRSGISVQLCGDAHLANFGAFATPDRRLVFDLNDFDETLPGPWEWDVKRLAASLAIAGRERGLDADVRRRLVTRAVRSYREAMRLFAAMGTLDVWYARDDAEAIVARLRARGEAKVARRTEQRVAKAHRKDRMRALAKLTTTVDGELRLISDPPLVVPGGELLEEYGVGDPDAVHERMRELVRAYRNTIRGELRHLLEDYRYVDVARKVVGVGSVGTREWIVLLLGRDESDPLFLQVKEAESSVLEPYLEPSSFKHCGRRVVEGQRLMQAAGDITLGWLLTIGPDGEPRHYYVRQLWDWKLSAEVEAMEPEGLELYGGLCGSTLARAHARSGDRVAIGAYLGRGDGFDRALAAFAESYADQSERDHAALLNAIEAGRVAAQPDA